jgi:hypothetical protein
MTFDETALERQAVAERARRAQRHEEGIVAATAALVFLLGMLVAVFVVLVD